MSQQLRAFLTIGIMIACNATALRLLNVPDDLRSLRKFAGISLIQIAALLLAANMWFD